MINSYKLIYLILSLVVLSWGINIAMVKYLTEFAPPILVAAVRMLLAGAALLPFALGKYGWYKPNLKQWLLLILVSIFLIFLHQLLLATGVVMTTATNATLILGLNPLITALLAAMFVGEIMNRRLFFGILVGFSGVVIVVLSNSANASITLTGWGDLIMFLAMMAYVIGGLLIKSLSATNMPTLVITAYSTLIGGVMLNVGAFSKFGASTYGQLHFTASAWLVLLISAWISASLGMLGWNYGIKLLGANRTAIFLSGMPIAGMIGAVLFLSEHIQWIHILAFILTTLGIFIGTFQPKADSIVKDQFIEV